MDDLVAVRRARADFLAADHSRPLSWRVANGAGIRPQIAASWERSRRAGVHPDHASSPYLDTAEPAELLSLAREPIDWLTEHLDAPGAALLLATSEARIIERRGDRALLQRLDDVAIADGHLLAEDVVGTNAIGTALVDNTYTQVRGPEHYRAALESFWCAGAPIIDPRSGRSVGALGLVSGTADTRFMGTLVRGAVRDIERALLDATPDFEQLLLNAFLAESHRSNEPLIALSQTVFIGNQSGLQLLQRSSRQRLWEQIVFQLDARRPRTIALETSTGSMLRAHATAISSGEQIVGALLRLSISTRSLRSVRAIPALPRTPRRFIPGDSPAAHRLRRAVHLAVQAGKPTLVTGEAGSGRSHVARVLLQAQPTDRPVVVVNLANDSPDGVRGTLAALRSTAAHHLLLRDIDRTADGVPALDVLVADATARGVCVVATATDTGRIQNPGVAALFSRLVQVPPLRARLPDLPEIAGDLLTKLAGSPHAAPALAESTLQALMAHDWPGNTRELQSILAAALSASDHEPTIRVEHLPDRYRAPERERRMSAIERAERKAIEDALEYAEGNKLAAAAALGIARSTLYRKMRALGLNVE